MDLTFAGLNGCVWGLSIPRSAGERGPLMSLKRRWYRSIGKCCVEIHCHRHVTSSLLTDLYVPSNCVTPGQIFQPEPITYHSCIKHLLIQLIRRLSCLLLSSWLSSRCGSAGELWKRPRHSKLIPERPEYLTFWRADLAARDLEHEDPDPSRTCAALCITLPPAYLTAPNSCSSLTSPQSHSHSSKGKFTSKTHARS